MSLGLRIKLSVMMFLQYFVWGIWLPMLGQQLGENGVNLDTGEIGWVFTVYGFGAILGPFIIGQLADRYFATEKVMAACHLIGGLLLIATAYVTRSGRSSACSSSTATSTCPRWACRTRSRSATWARGNQD